MFRKLLVGLIIILGLSLIKTPPVSAACFTCQLFPDTSCYAPSDCTAYPGGYCSSIGCTGSRERCCYPPTPAPPTSTPVPTSAPVCGGAFQACCSGDLCNSGFKCVPDLEGGTWCLSCSAAGEPCCSTVPICDPGLNCLYSALLQDNYCFAPTNTPTPTPTNTPIPVPTYASFPTCDSTRTNQTKCYPDGTSSYICDGSAPWTFLQNCLYGACVVSYNSLLDKYSDYCPPDPSIGYCTNDCNPAYANSSVDSDGRCNGMEIIPTPSIAYYYTVECWQDKATYDLDPQPTGTSRDCLAISSCSNTNNDCHPVTETCGGWLDCEAIYPGQGLVSHLNNCNFVDCGPPCAGPTSTPVAGPSNTPTPIPTSYIRARAVTLATVPMTCNEITSSTNWRDSTIFDLTSGTGSLGEQVQTGSSYVGWNVDSGTYNIFSDDDGSSIRSCLTDSLGTHFGDLSVNIPAGTTATFDLAYGPAGGWFQAQNGEVYSGNTIRSFVGVSAVTRYFNLNNASLVTYGNSAADGYDFSSALDSQGANLVSSTNWLANDTFTTRDFYAYYYTKFGSPTLADYENLTTPLDQPASRATPYYVVGDLTTNGNWTVGSAENLIFLVSGNLTLNGTITVTGTGFIAFIVQGDITVSPDVGTTFSSTVPVVEGMYLTSGTFHSGPSSGAAGTERFVGHGMFIANSFSLERDLTGVGQNAGYASELFIYDPQLLVGMPDLLKEMPITWEEVAP